MRIRMRHWRIIALVALVGEGMLAPLAGVSPVHARAAFSATSRGDQPSLTAHHAAVMMHHTVVAIRSGSGASAPATAPTMTTASGTPIASPGVSDTATNIVTPTAAASTPVASSTPATVSGAATVMPTTSAAGATVTPTTSATTDAYTPTVPLAGTPTPATTTARLLVQRIAAMRIQAAATGAPVPTITAVLFSGSAANPTITITGVGFGSPSAPETPGCAGFITNNGSVYPDLALGDDDPTHGFYAGGPGSCIGLVNLSYSDTRISYQFGSGYANFRGLYTLGQGDSYSLGVKGASFCGSVDYSGQPAANTCSPAPTPIVGGGTVAWHPHQSVRFAAGLDASVDLADGHVDVSAADLSIPGRGPDLTLAHVWDSNLAQAGVTSTAGQGWVDNLTPQMGGSLTGVVTYQDDSGATWPFTYTGSLGATGPYTTYSTPPGLPWQLTASTAGYTLTDILTSETLTFDAQGRYRADTDAYGNANTLSYGSSGPTSEANSGGRALAFSYQNGLLADTQSPLWQSSGGARGQHVAYGYNGAGQLTTLTWGAGTSDALTATFGYSGTQLTTVTTGANHQWTLGYDAQGRLATITSPASGQVGQAGYTPSYTTAFSYTTGQTQVVRGYGADGALTTTYTLDGQGEATAVQDGRGDTTRTTYDQDHDVLTRTDANNNTTSYTYAYVGPNGSTGLVTQTVAPPIRAYTPLNGALTPSITTNRYDPATYDLLETDKPEGGVTMYQYDGHHAVITTTELLAVVPAYSCPQFAVATAQRHALVASQPRHASVAAAGTACRDSFTWRGSVTGYDAYGERVAATDGRGVDVANTHNTTPDPQGITPTVQLDPAAASYTR